MSRIFILAFLLLIRFTYGQKGHDYPIAPSDDSLDVYFGEHILDPYQWMENPEDPRLTEWLAKQKRISKKERRLQEDEMVLRNQLSGMYNQITSKVSYGYVREKNKDQSVFIFKREI